MSEQSLGLIKELRAKTGAGIMEVKKALKEANGDSEKAIIILRKRGQKIALEKQARIAKEGWVGHYVHTNGKVAALVEVFCETDFVARNKEFQDLAHNLAMQIVALNPQYLSPQNIPQEEVEKERKIYREQHSQEKKPKNVLEKIIEGKLQKFYAEVCLLKQPYFRQDDITIEELISEKTAKLGEKIEIGRFIRFNL